MNVWFRIGAMLGFLAVGAGAFGAHGLDGRLKQLGTEATFQTAAEYHLTHALALAAVGLAVGAWGPSRASTVAGWSFVLGTLLFSGSLYVLALTGVRWLGAITPFGGLALLAGWIALAALPASGRVPASAESRPFAPTPTTHAAQGGR